MRVPRPILLLLSACLALPLAPAPSSAAPAPVPVARTGDTPRSERAEAALAAVRAAFAGDAAPGRRRSVDGRDLTLLLADLRYRLADLTPTDRRVARSFLARPTSDNDPFVRYGRRARPTNDCRVAPTRRSKVCVHWARRTAHAPIKTDRDRDGLPDQVEATRNVVNHVWKRIVSDGGFRKPPADRKGPDRKLDVYLADIGGQGLYGYCVTEDQVPGGRAFTGYCVVDDDYTRSQYPMNNPKQNLKVTVAHEFFHAVQFGYDAREATWFMEGSAAWIEDEIYDGVDDNHLYLDFSPLAHPERALDHAPVGDLSVYGSWIFWRFLTERYPYERRTGLPVLMKQLWTRADHRDATRPRQQAVAALRQELTRRGTAIPATYADFAAANRHPATARHNGRAVYEEGAAYERFVPPPGVTRALTQAAPVATGARTVDHLASSTVRFTTSTDLGAGRTLRLVAHHGGLGADAAVRVAVHPRTGPVRYVEPQPVAGGWQTLIGDVGAVRYVELTFVNGRADGGRFTMPFEATVLPR